jgi:hypothetical protein
VLASYDAFDTFPPAVFGLSMQQMRLRLFRRLPIAFGRLTMRRDRATARWVKPVPKQAEIRRDTVRVLRATAAERNLMVEIPDSYTLIPLDQPARLAEVMRAA